MNEALQKITEALDSSGKLPCVLGWKLASSLGITKQEIGTLCECNHIKISQCELGLFGAKKSELMEKQGSNETTRHILTKNAHNNHIACEQLWRLAAVEKSSLIDMAKAANDAYIKITPCCFGCF